MSDYYDDTVFDDPVADDLNEPEDGRDGQPYEGSSDAPESMATLDPLHKHRYLLDDDLSEVKDLDDEDAEEEWDDEGAETSNEPDPESGDWEAAETDR